MTFRQDYNFSLRKEEATRILKKYPERVPVLVEKHKGDKNLPKLDKKKYLVPQDLTVGQFVFTLRKRMEIRASDSMFLFFNDTLVPVSQTLGNVYIQHKLDDGFLYAEYCAENTFGTL